LNDAYRTLQDPVARVEYLLGLAGMRKEGQKKQQAPPELLEEVFEFERIARMSCATRGNPAEARQRCPGCARKLEAAQQ